MSTNTTWIRPFLCGVMTSMAASLIVPWFITKTTKIITTTTVTTTTTKDQEALNHTDEKQQQQQQQQQQQHPPQEETQSNKSIVMDSPSLDNRILRKAEAALRLRTSRLIIVVERCTNDHNYSAILRSAEALGVQHVYIIAPQDCNATLTINGEVRVDVESFRDEISDDDMGHGDLENNNNLVLHRSNGMRVKGYTEAEVRDRANHHLFAQRALEWLDVTEFDTTQECIDSLRKDGYHIWGTDLSQVAVTLNEHGLATDGSKCFGDGAQMIPDKLAIVFGTEAVGCSTQILEASDKRVYLPLRGFADSLNLSVATALVVHQLFVLDPTLVGAMPEEERLQLRRKWYAKLATQRIMTKSQKALTRRLKGQIKALEAIELKEKCPESHPFGLQKEQKEKLAKLPSLRQELQQLESEVYAKALLAVEDLVLHPPEPISDMRRHDEHRITYTGKNTKKKGGEAWANMPATRYVKVEVDTASFFRNRVQEKNRHDGSQSP